MTFADYKKEIEDYFRNNGLKVDPVPSVVFDWTKNEMLDPFISTGSYSYQTNTITLNVSNRQLKDILRTFAHELTHCAQYHTNPEVFEEAAGGQIIDNEMTQELEGEAYNVGNVLFRRWTEERKNKTL